MKKIVSKYDRMLLASLPRAIFPGRIEVVVDEGEAERATSYLMRHSLLGFDTETRPSFRRGRLYQVSLLQVSTDDVCFLFRLGIIGLPPCLKRLLSDREITKVGLAWHDDLHALRQRGKFEAGTFTDLQSIAGQMGIEDLGLQKLYANIFAEKISKGQQLSNWDADTLSEAQKLYAATDAWACLRLYREMTRMKEEGYELLTTDQPLAAAPAGNVSGQP